MVEGRTVVERVFRAVTAVREPADAEEEAARAEGERRTGMRLLVGTDLGARSSPAVETGAQLVEACGGHLILVNVLVPADLWDAPERPSFLEAAEALLDVRSAELADQARQFEGRVSISHHVELDESSDVASALVRVAVDERADVILVATRRAGGVRTAVVGSVAQDLIRAAPCPVLVMRPEARPRDPRA